MTPRELFSDGGIYDEYTNDNYELVLEEDIGFGRYYIVVEPGESNDVHKIYYNGDIINVQQSMEEAIDQANNDFLSRLSNCSEEVDDIDMGL